MEFIFPFIPSGYIGQSISLGPYFGIHHSIFIIRYLKQFLSQKARKQFNAVNCDGREKCFKQKRLRVETHSLYKENHGFYLFPSTHGFLQVCCFLPCRPIDILPKKEAIQKTKKTKVEKPKPHTLTLEDLYKKLSIIF